MKKIIFLLIIIGCSNERGEYYFEFDKVEYYTINIDEREAANLMCENNYRTELEELKSGIITGNKPETIAEPEIVSALVKVGYERKLIRKRKVEKFFRERQDTMAFTSSCWPVYRDVLIFRRRNKISGMAKICFECEKHQIIGSELETWNFGQSEDYKLLKEELYRKRSRVGKGEFHPQTSHRTVREPLDSHGSSQSV